MTDEERQRFARRLRERDAEIERLQTHSKSMIDALNADIDTKHAEIERLKTALQEIIALQDRVISEAGKAMRAHTIARRALETKP